MRPLLYEREWCETGDEQTCSSTAADDLLTGKKLAYSQFEFVNDEWCVTKECDVYNSEKKKNIHFAD